MLMNSNFKCMMERRLMRDQETISECNDQRRKIIVTAINNVNAASTNEVNAVGGKTSIELPYDPNMHALEDYSIFDFLRNDEDDGAMADMNNLDTTIQMSKNLEEHGFVSTIQQRTNHKDLQNCLFACFLSQEEPKKVIHALKDPSWIEAMQEELLQFKNKKDERGIVIRNKARLVAQGYTQEEGIDYDEVFALIEEEVYVCQPPGFEDPDFPDRVYKVEKALYRLHQAPRAWFTEVKTASTPMETQKPLLKDEDGEEVDVHMYRYLKGQPKLGLWYLKDSPFDLVAYTDSDYARASLDRKSTTGGCQFLRCRLISWQCKKQTVVVNSTTEAEYVAASS
ncbi:putative ribonuclease H-like domain-containing protein [Tanacetum coccineum]